MVAFIVAELGTRIPLAGYAYQWTARLMNSTYGWFVGFVALLNMTAAGGAIALLAASPLILSEFNVMGGHAHLVFAVAVMFLVLPVVFNIISVQWPRGSTISLCSPRCSAPSCSASCCSCCGVCRPSTHRMATRS